MRTPFGFLSMSKKPSDYRHENLRGLCIMSPNGDYYHSYEAAADSETGETDIEVTVSFYTRHLGIDVKLKQTKKHELLGSSITFTWLSRNYETYSIGATVSEWYLSCSGEEKLFGLILDPDSRKVNDTLNGQLGNLTETHLLNRGVLFDIGIYSPREKGEIKNEALRIMKNYIHDAKPQSWSFDHEGDEEIVYDISCDKSTMLVIWQRD